VSGGASGRGLGAPVVGASFDAFLRALPRLASAGPLRRRVLGEEHDLLDRFLAAIGVEDPREIDSARRQRTMASLIHRVRGAYASLSPAAQRRWLPLEDGVEPVLRSGGVLLLATHFGGGLLAPLALSRLGVPILTIIRSSKSPRLRASLEHPLLDLQDLEQVPGYAAAAKAVATLRGGGVVFLAGDLASERATDNLETTVLGRASSVSRGFAEIALAGGVRPTPVFSRVEDDGRIVTWIEAPLEAPGENRRARVDGLARAYGERLSEAFRRFPGNVSPVKMRRWLTSGSATGGGR